MSAKLGEKTLDNREREIEKEKREEKEKERDLLRKIRDLKVKRSGKRRDSPKLMDQPAQKRRRLDEIHYKRVRGEERTDQEKRKEEEVKGKKTEVYPMFRNCKKQRTWRPQHHT